MVGVDEFEAVAQHFVNTLAGVVGPFPSLAAGVGHRAPPGVQADPDRLSLLDDRLEVGLGHPARVVVVLVGDGRHPA